MSKRRVYPGTHHLTTPKHCMHLHLLVLEYQWFFSSFFIPSVFFSSLLCLKSAHERRLFTTPDLATEETSNLIKKNMHLRANQLIDADMRLTFSEESFWELALGAEASRSGGLWSNAGFFFQWEHWQRPISGFWQRVPSGLHSCSSCSPQPSHGLQFAGSHTPHGCPLLLC